MASLKELGDLVGGKVVGDPQLSIDGVSSLDTGEEGTITYLYKKKFQKFVETTNASAIIVSDEALIGKKNGIIVDDPRLAFVKVLEFFSDDMREYEGVHSNAIIAKSAQIGTSTDIGPNVVIGENVLIGDNVVIGPNNVIGPNVSIGNNCRLYSNIHICSDSKIGNNCILHSGVIIGADGFGFISVDDSHVKIPQIGKVIIGNDVEIGANSTIDRGTVADTIVHDLCKFDNGVQIGHNVTVGKGCLLTAHVTIAGSTKIGEYCAFGGQSGAIDNVTIGDRAIFACYTAVTKDLPGGKMYSGAPAREIKEKNKRDALYFDVSRLKKRIEFIEKAINK